jgi:PAB-dependent poly(A)-specific ribonuclease subunit 2
LQYYHSISQHFFGFLDLPGAGDLVALDAEFVSIQEEDTEMSESGDKIIIRETRHALARISVIDCRTDRVIIDDYVLPKEPVVDYLTRFSGIHPGDLDPKTSPHHLITARTAYLKLRFLVEQECIFVGHGLSSDFSTVNLFVPPSQIIDTVEIYKLEKRRHISLRFLANYVLKRDMQQDTHDSIEDARTAYELYKQAHELIVKNEFGNFLRDLYQYGDRTEWRLGIRPES